MFVRLKQNNHSVYGKQTLSFKGGDHFVQIAIFGLICCSVAISIAPLLSMNKILQHFLQQRGSILTELQKHTINRLCSLRVYMYGKVTRDGEFNEPEVIPNRGSRHICEKTKKPEVIPKRGRDKRPLFLWLALSAAATKWIYSVVWFYFMESFMSVSEF